MDPLPNAPVDSTPSPVLSAFRWDGHMCNGLGATYGTTPLAFLSASSSELVLSGPLGTFTLSLTSVVKIGRGRMYPWFFAGLRIHHTEPKLPEELQFKSLGAPTREIVAQLRALGYPVA